MQEIWNLGRGGHHEQEAFSLRFIIMAPDRREVLFSYILQIILKYCISFLPATYPAHRHTSIAPHQSPYVGFEFECEFEFEFENESFPAQVEGHWSAEVVMQVLRHLDGEQDSANVRAAVNQTVNEAVPA